MWPQSWFWVDLNEELAECRPGAPAADGANTGAGRSALLAYAGGGPARLRLSCLWGQLDVPLPGPGLEATLRGSISWSPGCSPFVFGADLMRPSGRSSAYVALWLCGGLLQVAVGPLSPARPGWLEILMTGDLVASSKRSAAARPDGVEGCGPCPLPASQARSAGPMGQEPFELLIFRASRASVTIHCLRSRSSGPASGAELESAHLLQGPLNPANEHCWRGPLMPDALLGRNLALKLESLEGC